MNFPDAWDRLLQDKAIRRTSWKRGVAIWVEADFKFRTGYSPRVVVRFLKRTNPKPYEWKTEDWIPEKEDVTATDWITATY